VWVGVFLFFLLFNIFSFPFIRPNPLSSISPFFFCDACFVERFFLSVFSYFIFRISYLSPQGFSGPTVIASEYPKDAAYFIASVRF